MYACKELRSASQQIFIHSNTISCLLALCFFFPFKGAQWALLSTSFNWQKPHCWAIKGQALADVQSAENESVNPPVAAMFSIIHQRTLSYVLSATHSEHRRVPPRLVFDLEASKRGSKRRLGDSSTRLWLLSEKHNSALCRCDPQDSRLNPRSARPLSTTAVGIDWRDPAQARPRRKSATSPFQRGTPSSWISNIWQPTRRE